MLPITHINYNFKIEKLLEIANVIKNSSRTYKNLTNWKWMHNVRHPYFYEIKHDLGISGWIDFYFQEPNSFLVPHIDPESLCGINVILTPEPAPVTFYENATSTTELGTATNYVYSQAILNTTVLHSVQTTDTERILFKICIPDESYESVVARIKYMVK
jgi:hypothetical protein